jgi:hypothetical protein
MAGTERNLGEDRTREFLDEWANWSGLKRLHITFDVDWAPDYMLRHLLELLDKEPEICCTFFATHNTELLHRVARQRRHEVGWHPNLSPGSSQGSGTEEVLASLARWYPDAVGCRFHVLGFSYRDLMMLAPVGLLYDVSRLSYNTSHLQPAFHRDLDLTLFPYCWEDGICENAGDEVSLASIKLASPGLKILNFHPMNVYINGPNAEARLRFMSEVGPLLSCPETVAQKHRLAGVTGAQRALEGLFDKVRREHLIARPLRELEQAFTTHRQGE